MSTPKKQLQRSKWFKRQKIKDESRAYTRLTKSDECKSYINANLDERQRVAIDKLIRLFKSALTEQCEIITTLYGAWNDFLIDGIQPTDDQVLDEVLTNWHMSKERIERDRWFIAINWMRKHDIVPTGFGIPTMTSARRADRK